MSILPKNIKMTWHAQQRLKERQPEGVFYNTRNLMRSSCRWYGKDDLKQDSSLNLHAMYVCRKSNQMGYLTDGNVEIVYNKGTGVAITVLEFKEKFKPLSQYIKPSVLNKLNKKEGK